MSGRSERSDPSAADLIDRLRHGHQTVAVAESLTGGAVTAALTAPPGASAVVRGGVVAYATDTKSAILGVDAALLARVGAVDAEVARQLALGVRDRFGATIGVAVTGVAGPSTQDGHQVGEVHVAVAGSLEVVEQSFDFGDLPGRAAVRQASVTACLALLSQVAGEHAG